jgi:ABC-type dipeptide/oligopeptide/nickel transport system permease subunit
MVALLPSLNEQQRAIAMQNAEVGIHHVSNHMNTHAWHDRTGSPSEMTVLFAQMAPASDHWADVFSGLDASRLFVLLIVVIGCVTGIILGLAGIICSALDSAHRRRLEAEMKRDMLDRGMSAEEIERVIQAATPEDITARMSTDAVFGKRQSG